MEITRKIEILTQAREILATRWCAWVTARWDASLQQVKHCHLGALESVLNWPYHGQNEYLWAQHHINEMCRRMFPELQGAVGKRPVGEDHFDHQPGVFVNNQLGQAAILRVYDQAIKELRAEQGPDSIDQAVAEMCEAIGSAERAEEVLHVA
jgi:hypothetical protein